jgi:hypothetical protein
VTLGGDDAFDVPAGRNPPESCASTVGRHSEDGDPRRVITCTTPLMASDPYNAEPCGPRMISIRSML